jgi:hypothetical protein
MDTEWKFTVFAKSATLQTINSYDMNRPCQNVPEAIVSTSCTFLFGDWDGSIPAKGA